MKARAQVRSAPDRGAAAVEFALLLPLLLLITFGIIDFGRALNAQITITQAAREGARVAALGGTNSQIQTRATTAAGGLSPVTVTVVGACLPNNGAAGLSGTVQVNYSFSFLTPIGPIAALFGGGGGSAFSSTKTLTATGVMPCET